MNKHGLHALLGVFLVCFTTACHTGQQSTSTSEEAVALRTQVQSGTPPTFVAQSDDGRKVWSAAQKVYQLRGFRPIWISQGQTTPQIDSLIRTFESTEAEGFSAEDLGMAEIHGRRETIKTSKDLAQLIDVETYFTYSLVRCASYLSSGRA